jgi:hypothetical protein
MALATCVPDLLEMIVGERLNLVVDFTNLIADGDDLSVGAVRYTAVLEVEGTGEVVSSAILGVPFITPAPGNPNGRIQNSILNLTITTELLRPKTDYTLRLTAIATGGAGSKTVSAVLLVRMIY